VANSKKDDDLHKLLHSLKDGWQDFRSSDGRLPLKVFPITETLKGYSWTKCKADIRAACNVSLLDIPQGIAYAAVAGLPLHYGVTCSATASTLGPAFASSRLTILGPTNATAFMVFSYFAANAHLPQILLMPLLVFMVGVFLLIGAWLRMAELTQYISRTVIVAYVTGAAILIIGTQLPAVMGITLLPLEDGAPPRTLPGIVLGISTQISDIGWPSLLIALVTALTWWWISRSHPKLPAFILALLIGSVSGVALQHFRIEVPMLQSDPFSWRTLIPQFPDFNTRSVLPEISRLFGLALALAFLSTLESTAMARSLASRSGQRIDPNQDMLALGISNIGCAYLSGMPASGSLTRSALNRSAGGQTPLASVFNGLLCLTGALLLMPLVLYIPKAALASLIVLVAVTLIHRRNIRISLLSTNSDALTFLATFILTLLIPLHVAIFAGVGISIVLYLRKASRPSLVEYAFNKEGHLAEAEAGRRNDPSISIVHVEGELFFGAADLFRTQIQRISADPNLRIIILRLKNARHLDATSVMALEELIEIMRADGRDVIVSGAMRDVYRVLRDSGLVEVLGRENLFPGSALNPNLATRKALRRAQEILGTDQANVQIYFDPSKQVT
jgi:sulfate permease, SulP family